MRVGYPRMQRVEIHLYIYIRVCEAENQENPQRSRQMWTHRVFVSKPFREFSALSREIFDVPFLGSNPLKIHSPFFFFLGF